METTRFTAPHDYNKMIIIIVHIIFTKRRKHPGNCFTKWLFCFCGCWTPAKRIFFFVHLCNFTEADWCVVAALQTGRELSCCSFAHIEDDTQFLESSVHQRSPHAAGGETWWLRCLQNVFDHRDRVAGWWTLQQWQVGDEGIEVFIWWVNITPRPILIFFEYYSQKGKGTWFIPHRRMNKMW